MQGITSLNSCNQRLVGIAEMLLSSDPETVIAAPNLGSCLGVAVYDPQNRVGGLIHCLLPSSAKDPDKAKLRPYMYVDTGVVALLQAVLAYGAAPSKLIVTVAGGAQISDENNVFQIGKKNYTVLRKLLWKNNLLIHAEDIGGSLSRTISLDIGTGQTFLRIAGQWKLLE